MAPAAFDDTCRLIPGRYTEDAEHALGALAADEDDLRSLIQLAAATNPRLQAQEERHPGGLGRDDVVFGVPFSKIVNAAFAYPGQGARFHGPYGRGAWYCALDVETCLAEVVFHRAEHLRETGATDEDAVPYRLFLADVRGQDFAWLDDDRRQSRRCLAPDSYAEGQVLGARLREHGSAGVVYPSVRRDGGTCLAVLQPPIVGNVRRSALYRLTIRGLAIAAVERTA